MQLKPLGIFMLFMGTIFTQLVEQNNHCCAVPGTLYNNAVLDIAEPIEDNKNWDVAGEHGPIKKLSFTTSEGTWISLDISPDAVSYTHLTLPTTPYV